MRGLAVALVLAMSPLAPAMCAVMCAEGAHTMPGMPTTGHHEHQMHMASHRSAPQQMVSPGGHGQGERLVASPEGPCDHAFGTDWSFVRPDDSTRLNDIAVSMTAVAVSLDEPLRAPLRFTGPPSASPPLNRPATAPLRI